MNSKLEEMLATTLEKAINTTQIGLSKAIDFASEQIPDVINQLMIWEFAYHSIMAISQLIFVLLLVWVSVYSWKKSNEYDPMQESYVGLKLPIFISALIGFCMIFGQIIPNILTVAKIKFAPKIFLIEYCGDLLEARKSEGFHQKHNH